MTCDLQKKPAGARYPISYTLNFLSAWRVIRSVVDIIPSEACSKIFVKAFLCDRVALV